MERVRTILAFADSPIRSAPLLFIFVLSVGCGGHNMDAKPEVVELPRFPPGVHQQTVEIPGIGSMNYTIEIPTGYNDADPAPLVLVLHFGYRGDTPSPYTGGEMIGAFRGGLAPLNAIIIAPDALGGRWSDTRNELAAVWLTTNVIKTYAIDTNKVIVTGFSLGGEGAWFIGSRHQDLFTAAIPVAAPPAGGSAEWSIPAYVIHSDKDEIISYDAAKKHADSLKGKGAKLEFKTVHGLSHYHTGAYGEHVGDAVKWLEAEWKRASEGSPEQRP
jgi:predicted peptidase